MAASPSMRSARPPMSRVYLHSPDFAALAPILCAGVTTYKGLKETEARPGEWVAISGIGGLGHAAVQYAKAMGLHVVALDVTDEKLALARALGADVAVNALAPDAVEQVTKATSGGAHGVLVTAVSPPAFAQAIHMTRRRGTISLVGLPPGDFATPIFEVVLKRITIRGSIVGHSQGPRRGDRVCRRRQGAFAYPPGPARGHQRHLRRPEGGQGRRADGHHAVACPRQCRGARLDAIQLSGPVIN